MQIIEISTKLSDHDSSSLCIISINQIVYSFLTFHVKIVFNFSLAYRLLWLSKVQLIIIVSANETRKILNKRWTE